ncbi:16624_t:CDS:2, partial [Dentiscutata heterogama]
VNQVHLTDKKDLNLTVVWAIGAYPLESKDHELEMVLFVPIRENERDPNIQSIFIKDEYYRVGGKVVPDINNDNFKLKRVDSVTDSYAEYANSTASNYYSSRHVRVDDEADDHVKYVDSHYDENKHTIEHNKEHTEKSDRCGENIILENEGEASHLKKTNKSKEKEFQPIVHNTRCQTNKAK